MRKRGNEYKILVRNTKGKNVLGRHGRRWEANMKISHKEMYSCMESDLVRLRIRSSLTSYTVGNATSFSKQPGNYLSNSFLFMPGFVLELLLREYVGITVECNAPKSLVPVTKHGQFHSIIVIFVSND